MTTHPRSSPESGKKPIEVPHVSPWLFRQFAHYTEWYLRRHFRQILVHRESFSPIPHDQPLICLLNHPCWWDPLIGILLARRYFSERLHFAAMNDAALQSYGIFQRLGFFGVEQKTAHGAVNFLRMTEAILKVPSATLWITPQGRFADVRERPIHLHSGVSHVTSRLDRGIVLPIALEYFFAEERLPFVAVEFGELMQVSDHIGDTPEAWNLQLTRSMQQVQERLAARIISRDRTAFEVLLDGKSGMGNWYGWWRSWHHRGPTT